MKQLVLASIIVLAVIFLAGPAAALQLIYPLDGTYVTRSNYLIVKGGTDPMLDGLSIEINGVKSDVIDISSEAYRNSFGDMLIVEPIFDPGENRIVVEGYLGSEKLDTVRAVVYYHNRLYENPPDDYSRERFHEPGREKACVECHNMSPTEAELDNPNPRENPCASCHMRMLNKAHVHGPAGVYDCAYCHQPDSQPTRYRPRAGDAELCLECHADMQQDFRSSEFVHGPIDAGSCLICHDPHASDEIAQVVMPINTLCLECHGKISNELHVVRGPQGKGHPLAGVANPLQPERQMNCASCHAPHAADAAAMFNFGVTSRMALCGKCHAK